MSSLVLIALGLVAQTGGPEAGLPLVPLRTSSVGYVDTSTTPTLHVEVREQRLERPFDPHAAVVLTGREIAERGITNLAEAIEQLPAAFVRSQGRGGFQADVRGARKGALLVLVDGMPISDPFFGNFDVTTVPATDIAELRLSTAPASPIDGPGGNGGVVEVITRSAIGRARGFVRASAASNPAGRGALSAKGELVDGFGVRVSGTGALDARSYPFDPAGSPPTTVTQEGRSGTGALLLEWVGRGARLGADLSFGQQRYVVPPSDQDGTDLVVIDRETTTRASLLGELTRGALRLSARGFVHALERNSLRYPGGDRAATGALARVAAVRSGGFARADWAADDTLSLTLSTSLTVENGRETGDAGDGADGTVTMLQTGGGARWQPLSWLRMDGALGAALPFASASPLTGRAPSPWPEARATLGLDAGDLTVELIGARKGRVPTLRERFQPSTGNPAIEPEQSSFGELSLTWRPAVPVMIRVGGWTRTVEGVIKIPLGGTQLGNAGDLVLGGLDTRVDVGLFGRALEVGVAYFLQGQSGENPFDFYPTHRGELWARGRIGRSAGLWGRLKYLGDRVDQGVSLGEFISADLGGWYKLDVVRILGRVENLADSGWLAHRNIRGPGRSFWLGIEVETP